MSKIDHRNKDDWRDAFIDPKIRSLIAAMNQPHTGIQTIACCQGHYWGNSDPYIYFKCSPDRAQQFERKLRVADTNHRWQLTGSFNAQFEHCFSLRSNALFCATRFNRLMLYVIHRQRIDEDFSALMGLFEQPLSVRITQKVNPICSSKYKPTAAIIERPRAKTNKVTEARKANPTRRKVSIAIKIIPSTILAKKNKIFFTNFSPCFFKNNTQE